MRDITLLEALINAKEIATHNSSSITTFAKKWHLTAFDSILKCHLLSEAKLADIVAKFSGKSRVFNLSSMVPQPEVFSALSYEQARSLVSLPIGTSYSYNGAFEVVIANPFDNYVSENLEASLKRKIQFLISEKSEILAAIDELYPLELQLKCLEVSHES